MAGPLAGVRVLDLTTVLVGPYCTQILAEMGADVLKVEAPEGDVVRLIGPARHPGMGCMFLTINRGKRSIALDLKRPEGRDALLRLARNADVLVTNIRPRAMARLGLDYEAVRAANPRIVYASVLGFGQDGPYAAQPAYDDLMQGATGIAALNGGGAAGRMRRWRRATCRSPWPTASPASSRSAPSTPRCCTGSARARGSGSRCRCSRPWRASCSATISAGASSTRRSTRAATRGCSRPGGGPTARGTAHVCTMIYNDRQWRNFCAAAGLPDLVSEDPRFASHATRTENIDAILAMLERVFAERDTAEWVRVLEEADLPVAPLHTLESIVRDPHLVASGFFAAEEHPTRGPPGPHGAGRALLRRRGRAAAAAPPGAAPGRARGGGAPRGRLRRGGDRGAVR